MKSLTTIQAATQLRTEKEALICELLGWTPEEMFWFKVEACSLYLNFNYKNLAAYLMGEKKLWNWWLNQWALRDMTFLNEYSKEESKEFLHDQYNYTHSVAGITVSPRFAILKANLEITIDRLIEDEERKVQHV